MYSMVNVQNKKVCKRVWPVYWLKEGASTTYEWCAHIPDKDTEHTLTHRHTGQLKRRVECCNYVEIEKPWMLEGSYHAHATHTHIHTHMHTYTHTGLIQVCQSILCGNQPCVSSRWAQGYPMSGGSLVWTQRCLREIHWRATSSPGGGPSPGWWLGAEGLKQKVGCQSDVYFE